MLLRANVNFKDLQVDYEREVDVDLFYLWGVDKDGNRTIIMSMTEEEASALCSALGFALQDRGLTKSEVAHGQQ